MCLNKGNNNKQMTKNDVLDSVYRLINLSDKNIMSLLGSILDTCTYYDDNVQLIVRYPIHQTVTTIKMSKYIFEITIIEYITINNNIRYHISDMTVIDITSEITKIYDIDDVIQSQINTLTVTQQRLNERKLNLMSSIKGE